MAGTSLVSAAGLTTAMATEPFATFDSVCYPRVVSKVLCSVFTDDEPSSPDCSLGSKSEDSGAGDCSSAMRSMMLQALCVAEDPSLDEPPPLLDSPLLDCPGLRVTDAVMPGVLPAVPPQTQTDHRGHCGGSAAPATEGLWARAETQVRKADSAQGKSSEVQVQRRKRMSAEDRQRAERTVHVRGLQRFTTEEEVLNIARGALSRRVCQLSLSRGDLTRFRTIYAFVEFRTREEAFYAVQELHAMHHKGNVLQCAIARTPIYAASLV